MTRKHTYASRADCPNFHPVTPEDPDGWCGCGVEDLQYEIKWKRIALESKKVQVKNTEEKIRQLEDLLIMADS